MAHTHEADDTINTIKPPTIKRQRSDSISASIPRQPSTPLFLRNENETCNKEIVGHSDPEESRGNDIYSKRRKVSSPLGGRIAHKPSQPSPPVSDEGGDDDYEEDDGAFGISVNAKHTSFSRTTPVSEVTSPTEHQIYPVATDVDQDWEVRKIIGKEHIDGVLHYMVDWCPTLLAEHSLEHAKELVDEFEARIQA